MMAKKNGRPSKLTPKLQKVIINLIKAGYFIETVCSIVGINKTTYYAWMKRGKESNRRSQYKTFYDEVTRAHAICEVRMVSIISKAAETDWRASAWYLEHRFPQRWGKPGTKKYTSMKIDYGNYSLSVNSPYTKLDKHEKSAVRSVVIKNYVKTKNY